MPSVRHFYRSFSSSVVQLKAKPTPLQCKSTADHCLDLYLGVKNAAGCCHDTYLGVKNAADHFHDACLGVKKASEYFQDEFLKGWYLSSLF